MRDEKIKIIEMYFFFLIIFAYHFFFRKTQQERKDFHYFKLLALPIRTHKSHARFSKLNK
jgi:hypothetical protein